MKSNPFNICPTCMHRETCVLTQQKNQVWSCSEYDEETSDLKSTDDSRATISIEDQPEMAMA
ncbi:hypothetical protein BC962_1642 [Gillisia mitskevichiae]|uniref:Uncharacterized protein n=1 Tax=Gillisia mitskevichiae TaxID=270921 RepID=A0A495PV19_9FLAO|nr:hypothetical protein [Gillisia mitskevichiae]RKS53392.1 hypothetical protein BC962_1642 [Gillisia mitskevichiae]